MIPTIRTARLTLRPPRRDDAPHLARYLNDFAVSGNLARVPHPYGVADAEAWLRTQRADTPVADANFAIEAEGEGYVGHVGFHLGPKGPVIGYWLGQPFWGRGYMTEAAIAALDFYFTNSPATQIRSGVFHFNGASLTIQRKLGFTETGRSTLLCLARGAEVEHIDTQLTRERFRQIVPSVARRGDAATAKT